MRKILLFCLLIASFEVSAQKTINDSNVEKRNVGSFHGIEVSTGIQLILSQGNSEEVAVSAATTEFRDKIVTKVVNGVLKIHYDSKLGAINKKKENKDLKAYVSCKDLDILNAHTGATVEIDGKLKTTSLQMKVNTGAIVKGTVETTDLDVNQDTGSIITLDGSASTLKVDGNTGSMFKGLDLKTNNCTITTSTGAGIYITVQKELSVKANTGGFVKYKGGASISELKTNTGGSVSKI